MKSKLNTQSHKGKRSIFHSLFVPLILIMILQACIFYFAAVYGGIERSLSQNAADILNERLQNRTNELATSFNNTWTNFDTSTKAIDTLYEQYQVQYGTMPFLDSSKTQTRFLSEITDTLVDALRQNEVNGVFLILNNQESEADSLKPGDYKYGLCIRDMDQKSNYTDREDLQLERGPSSIIDQTRCSLDSWWEGQYYFTTEEEGDYYYNPLSVGYQNPTADGDDLAYFSGPHCLGTGSQEVVSYSIPLLTEDGYPYGVLGIELTTKYLASILPSAELGDADSCCYILALQQAGLSDCTPIVPSGILYNRCFDRSSIISTDTISDLGGFTLTGRGDVDLYGAKNEVVIYNNNNPFEDTQLVLIGLEERDVMFSYIEHIKRVLLLVALLSLGLGIICILFVSRHFARPITALANRVRKMKPEEGFDLGRLGITEIDQLVDSIETLNQNVSRDTARTEFFSRMSHDMRTPMNAIISFSSPELLEDADEETKDNYLDKIHSSGNYLLGLINEVLDMTKIESKKTDLTYEPIPISQVWSTCIPIIEKLAQKKSITFVQKLPEHTDFYVMADEQHLSQIILNLLSNAVKFTPLQGMVHLMVDISKGEQTNQIDCHITVSDNGIGISEEFMQRLYTPFEQENEGRDGTGLGLSIAKKLVEMMGGSISCESAKGRGTTFHLTIPFDLCETPAVTQPSDAIDADAATALSHADSADVLTGKRILVCEDHPLNTQIICKLLEKKKIVVTTAQNGSEGLNIFETHEPYSFDAILMDIRMPVMDGLEAATRIRSLNRTDAKEIPIIAMTANAFAEDVRASHNAGMNEHLSKPIEPDKLYHTLENYLGDA